MRLSTGVTVGDVKGWGLTVLVALTLAMELLDVWRSPVAPPPARIESTECYDVCRWAGTEVQVWALDRCECRPAGSARWPR